MFRFLSTVIEPEIKHIKMEEKVKKAIRDGDITFFQQIASEQMRKNIANSYIYIKRVIGTVGAIATSEYIEDSLVSYTIKHKQLILCKYFLTDANWCSYMRLDDKMCLDLINLVKEKNDNDTLFAEKIGKMLITLDKNIGKNLDKKLNRYKLFDNKELNSRINPIIKSYLDPSEEPMRSTNKCSIM